VARLDDPAACFPLGGLGFQVDLFAANADVRRQIVVADQLTDGGVVIRLVQTDALRLLRNVVKNVDDRLSSRAGLVSLRASLLIFGESGSAPRFR
jgi:hypothetical protein